MEVTWETIEGRINDLKSVKGGFSSAKRGLLILPDGREVFIKIGLQEDTKRWAKKEIAVYRFLKKHRFFHIPRLIATNNDKTGFAIEALNAKDGWNWRADWDSQRVSKTLEAMDELAAIRPDYIERDVFCENNFSQADDGWQMLLNSPKKQKVLIDKLRRAGENDVVKNLDFVKAAGRSSQYVFANDVLVHYDLRADNCPWNANLQEVRIVDWNWTQFGDRDIDLAATLTSIKKSGFEFSDEILDRLNPDALHWVAGFWFQAAATPIWSGGQESLRDLQLDSGVVAMRLIEEIGKN